MIPPPPRLLGADAVRITAHELALRPMLVVSDFDGTLAHFVMDPWGASIVAPARVALRRLAGTPGVHVVLLSGRIATDLAARVRVGGALYLGNQGVERGWLPRRVRAEAITTEMDATLAPYVEGAEGLAAGVSALIAEPWLVVERKGPAVSFHYRAAPDVPAAGSRVAAAVDEVDPDGRFVRHVGRRILELRPPGARDKGETLRMLVAEVRPALTFMLGDDRTDAQAFAALRDLRDAGTTRGLAVAVHAGLEMPDAVAETADVALASPEETARFLAGLAARVRASAGANRSRPDAGTGTRPTRTARS